MDRLKTALVAAVLSGCGARVSPALPLGCDGPPTHFGCEFWATSTLTSHLHEGFEFGVTVTNPNDEPARVRVEGSRLSAAIERTIAPRSSIEVPLPWIFELSGHRDNVCLQRIEGAPPRATHVADGSYRITSDRPVSVVQYNPLISTNGAMAPVCSQAYSKDASLLWPTRALGARYVIAALPNELVGRDDARSFVTVVGTAEQRQPTTVRVVSNVPFADPERPGSFRTAPLTFTVRRGEAMQLPFNSDFSATASIEADAPIAVFSGHDCLRVPTGIDACDHVEEQARPVSTWGREYVIPPVRDRAHQQPVHVRFIAANEPVDLSFSGTAPPAACPRRLQPNTVCAFVTVDGFTVTGSAPFSVEQITPSRGTVAGCSVLVRDDRECFGDPSLVSMTPREQFLSEYHFSANDPVFDSSVAITAPADSTILLDDVPVTAVASATGDGWQTRVARVSLGYHSVRSADGTAFGLILYGSGYYASYITPAGSAAAVLQR